MAQKPSVADLMRERGLTRSSLTTRSGLSEPTVRRAVNGDNTARLNTSSATEIARALGSPVGEINWPGGLANEGRPARSGGSYTRRSQ